MKLVPENKEFTFKGLCPYCEGDLTYHVEGWEQEEDGTWIADYIQSECSTMPGLTSRKFNDWMNQHSDMPYVNQLPVDERVKKWINKRYRFDIK
jgi:hypothetical protein